MYGNLDDFGCTAVDLNSFICKWPFFAKSKFTFAFFREPAFFSRVVAALSGRPKG